MTTRTTRSNRSRPRPGIEERTLALRLPLHLDLRRPVEPPASGLPPVLVGLHGYAGSKESMMGVLSKVVPHDFLVVTIEGPHTTFVPGTEGKPSRQTAYHWGVGARIEEIRALHRQVVAAAIRLAVREGGDRSRVVLAGFSQPCSYNYRFAARFPKAVAGLVALCGGVPGEWTTDDEVPRGKRSGARILHVSTRSDPFYPVEVSTAFPSRLAPRFLHEPRLSLHDGEHRIPPSAYPEIRAFLSELGSPPTSPSRPRRGSRSRSARG